MTTLHYIYTPYNPIYNESNKNNFLFPQVKQIPIDQKPKAQRKNWKKEEDERLLKLIEKYGPHRWKLIAEIIQTKSAKQCRDHYFNCLDPKIRNSLWTEDEEKILLKKYQQYGSHWSKIKRFLPGRTNSMIKAYLRVLLKKTGSDKNEDLKKPQPVKNDILDSSITNANFDMSIIENLLNKKA